MSLRTRLKKARKAYLRKRSGENLRRYLSIKARLGIFDERMCRYTGVNPNVNKGCRKAICRAYAAGLVPTDTLRPVGSSSSYHAKRTSGGEGCGVDFGLRGPEIGTQRGLRKMQTFQRKEHWRRRAGKINPVEIIGPDNRFIVLRGREADLAEGTALETQHDNHVHEAYIS